MRVVVIGAGIVGAACARALASAGLVVTVLERGAVAGGTSSSCEGNLLVSDKTPGPELSLAVLTSMRWPQLAAELDDQGRIFGRSVEHILAGGTDGSRFADGVGTDRRPIATPIRLGELSRAAAPAGHDPTTTTVEGK